MREREREVRRRTERKRKRDRLPAESRKTAARVLKQVGRARAVEESRGRRDVGVTTKNPLAECTRNAVVNDTKNVRILLRRNRRNQHGSRNAVSSKCISGGPAFLYWTLYAFSDCIIACLRSQLCVSISLQSPCTPEIHRNGTGYTEIFACRGYETATHNNNGTYLWPVYIQNIPDGTRSRV